MALLRFSYLLRYDALKTIKNTLRFLGGLSSKRVPRKSGAGKRTTRAVGNRATEIKRFLPEVKYVKYSRILSF